MNRRILWICLFLITLIIPAWLCETAFTGYKFDQDFYSSNPDGLYYYRIAEQAIKQNSTEPLVYDTYGNFPYKHKIGFPPLFIRFLYWTKLLLDKIIPGNSDFYLGFAPVIFGWLTALCIVLTLWYCKYPNNFLLFLAFSLIPLYPGLITYEYGCYDHDFFVSFFMWIWLLSAVLYYEKETKLWIIVGGIGSSIVLGSWIGALLVFLLITFSCLGVWFFNSSICKKYLRYSYSTTAITVLLNSCMIAIAPKEYGFALLDFGMFHVLCVAAAAVFIYCLTKFENSIKNKLIFITGALGAIAVTGVAMGDGFVDLLERVSASDPVFMNIAELKPMIAFSKLFKDVLGIKLALLGLSWTFFFLPLFMLFPIEKLLKKESAKILQIWLSLMVLAGFVQIRYIRLPALGCGVFIAIVVFSLWKLYFKFFEKNNKNYVNFSSCFLVMLLFVRAGSSQFFVGYDSRFNKNVKDTLDWISKNTEPTSGFFDNKKPEYGILAYWDIGHAINAYAHRPAIVNNCQWGMKNMADVFSSTSEKEAYELCKKLCIKYVLISPNRLLAKESADFWPAYKNLPDHDGYRALPGNVERSENIDGWFYLWLKDSFGLQKKAEFNVTSNFRVIYANYQDKAFPIANDVVFERVEGARVNLNAKPGSKATMSLDINVSGRAIKYKKEMIVSEDGTVCFTLPYSCYFNNDVVATGELYSISIVSRETGKQISGNLIVKEKDVVEGNQVATRSIRLFK